MQIFDQHEFNIRLEWGLRGVEILAPVSDIVIIIDVLSFSTCVDAAVSAGISIYPYRWFDESAQQYARQIGAILAAKRGSAGFSLSPSSFLNASATTPVVLPSPNGSELSLSTGNTPTLCGCLRNAQAVAAYAMQGATNVAVIPAGEKWHGGDLRPAYEDWLGAGAIISFLKGSLSPESQAALSVFQNAKNIKEQMMQCSSGKELIAKGFEADIKFAAELNASNNVPVLRNGAYQFA